MSPLVGTTLGIIDLGLVLTTGSGIADGLQAKIDGEPSPWKK